MAKTYFVCLSFLLIATEVVRCETEYSFNFEASVWFKLHTTPETWEEAFLKCHNEGAALASPLNIELANALYSMARYDVNGTIFLGTHDLFSKGNFASIEGVPLSYMEVMWGSEDNVVDAKHCLSMSVDGRVHYSSCTESLPFICYRKLENQTMNECGTYDNEYHLNSTGSCYKLHQEQKSWYGAYSTCASEGGHLVILNDKEEAHIVRDMFPAHSGKIDRWEQFHVGAAALGKNRTWITIHGQRIEDVFNVWMRRSLTILGASRPVLLSVDFMALWMTSALILKLCSFVRDLLTRKHQLILKNCTLKTNSVHTAVLEMTC